MDTAAIAAVMGTGTGAVEQLLVRARAGLRSRTGLKAGLALSDQGEDDGNTRRA
jgi:hypothetical protein